MLLRTNTLIVAANYPPQSVYYSSIHFVGGNITLDLAAYLVSRQSQQVDLKVF